MVSSADTGGLGKGATFWITFMALLSRALKPELSTMRISFTEPSRQMVKDRIRLRLDADERSQVEDWLEAAGLSAAFLP